MTDELFFQSDFFSLMAIEFIYRNEAKKISQVPDWSDTAQAGEHLWQSTSISGDFCYVGESECSVRQNKKLLCFLTFYFSLFNVHSINHNF